MIVSNASLRLRPQGVRVKLPPAPTLHSWGNNTWELSPPTNTYPPRLLATARSSFCLNLWVFEIHTSC